MGLPKCKKAGRFLNIPIWIVCNKHTNVRNKHTKSNKAVIFGNYDPTFDYIRIEYTIPFKKGTKQYEHARLQLASTLIHEYTHARIQDPEVILEAQKYITKLVKSRTSTFIDILKYHSKQDEAEAIASSVMLWNKYFNDKSLDSILLDIFRLYPVAIRNALANSQVLQNSVQKFIRKFNRSTSIKLNC
jgi:hypothetical protein